MRSPVSHGGSGSNAIARGPISQASRCLIASLGSRRSLGGHGQDQDREAAGWEIPDRYPWGVRSEGLPLVPLGWVEVILESVFWESGTGCRRGWTSPPVILKPYWPVLCQKCAARLPFQVKTQRCRCQGPRWLQKLFSGVLSAALMGGSLRGLPTTSSRADIPQPGADFRLKTMIRWASR